MNKTVALVKLWGAYEEQHPQATLEDFFRYQLSALQKTEKPAAETWQMVPDLNGELVKLIRRIGKFHMVYSNKALEGTGLDQIEEFGILVSIFNQVNPIKSEAIFNNIMELSSGSNMLIRLKERGLVSEYADTEDKRVKRLKLTAKGEETLKKAKKQVLRVAAMMVHDLTDEEKQLCLQILTPIDTRFSAVAQKQKNKSFDEVFDENMTDR